MNRIILFSICILCYLIPKAHCQIIDLNCSGLYFATNEYDNFPDLINPIIDAKAIAQELEDNYGFNSDIRLNASGDELLITLRNYTSREYDPADHLLIFIAGHGEFDEITKEGFLVMQDSELSSRDLAKRSFIPFSRLREIINNIPCNHILLVMDVCHGGTFDRSIALFNSSGRGIYDKISGSEYVSRKLRYKTRIYLTSGGKEYVPDGRPGHHSPFTRSFLQAIRSYGGEDNIITLNEINWYLERVKPEPRSGEFGDNEPGSDFIFVFNHSNSTNDPSQVVKSGEAENASHNNKQNRQVIKNVNPSEPGISASAKKFQSDLLFDDEQGKGLEIIRVSNDDHNAPGEFGRSWSLVKPIQLQFLNLDTVISGGYIWDKYCTISNTLTGKTDTMVFSPDLYNYVGYCPVDEVSSEYIILMPLSDGSFELADKQGKTYAINPSGKVSSINFGNTTERNSSYSFENCDPANNPEIPFSLKVGNDSVDFGSYTVASEIQFFDHASNEVISFFVDTASNYLEYYPEGESEYQGIAPLSNEEFLLVDINNREFYFDVKGCISEIYTIKEDLVSFTYFDDGIDVISDSPYSLTKASNEYVKVELEVYTLSLPEKLFLMDKAMGESILFEYHNSDTCVCYITTDQSTEFTSVYYLTNGYYLAENRSGDEIYFDEGGNFVSIQPGGDQYIKSIQQGDHRADFNYTILGDCMTVVNSIEVYSESRQELEYTINYQYDDDGYLIDKEIISDP